MGSAPGIAPTPEILQPYAPSHHRKAIAMRLAFYTYSYTDRLQMPLEPALERIAEAGYDGIDISGTHGPSDDPASVTPDLRRRTRTAAERLGLRVEAVVTHATLVDSLWTDAPLDLTGTVDLAVDVGAPVVVFHMGGAGDAADRQQQAWRRVVDTLKRSLDHAESRGVRIAVDGVWRGWIVDTPEAFLRLYDDVGSTAFGINLDPCCLTLLGFDPAAVAAEWRQRILHAHVKDHVGHHPEWEHRIPGEGDMDYAPVVRALRDVGFAGALAIETFTHMGFEASCDVGYATLAPLLDRPAR